MRLQTNYSLKRTYHYFNRGWFGGRLPSIPIRFGRVDGDSVGEYNVDTRSITIAFQLRKYPRWTANIVLHEMVHVKHHLVEKIPPSRLGHGRKFLRDMKWLVNHGAMDKLL
jgi:hypothetical protein